MIISNNTFSGNYAGFTTTGNIADAKNQIDTSNLIDGLPLMYLEGVSNQVIENITPSTLYLQNCSRIEVKNLVMPAKNGYGITVKGGANIHIINCTINQNLYQNILAGSVQGINISGCQINASSEYGIGFINVQNGTISDCSIRENKVGIAIKGDGAYLAIVDNELTNNGVAFLNTDNFVPSGFGKFSKNTINGGITGIESVGAEGGIYTSNLISGVHLGINLSGSRGLRIEDNQMSVSDTGIALSRNIDQGYYHLGRCSGNLITRNNVSAGVNPIQLSDSGDWIFDNSIQLNDFIQTLTEDSKKNSSMHIPDNKASWGGVSIRISEKSAVPTVTIINNTGNNQWHTGDRVRYTYGNLTFSGILGNHWSTYHGTEIGASGVGQEPQKINIANVDSYPLISSHTQYLNGIGGYPIYLNSGWNLVSTPSELSFGYHTAKMFEDVATAGHSIYTFSNGSWIRLRSDDRITPLLGYWIFADNSTTVPLVLDPGTIPAPLHLNKGWSLIGHPGIQPAKASDALSSLDTAWSYLISYNASTQKYDDLIEQKNGSSMLFPSQGYWISMNQEWDLQPITG